MNMVMVDVTHVPRVRVGDEVVLLGRSGDEVITAEMMADWAGTIHYEVISPSMSESPVFPFGGLLTESSKEGQAVFFDMDGTLTACNTGRIYAEELWKARELNTFQWVGFSSLLLRYRFGVVRLERVMDRIIREGKGKPEKVVRDRCVRLSEEHVIPAIFQEARRRLPITWPRETT